MVEYEIKAPPSKVMGKGAAIGRKLSEIGVYSGYVASIALKNKIVDVVDVERGLDIPESIQSNVLDLAARRYETSSE